MLLKDRKGFEYLYDNYSSVIYGTIYKIVHSEEMAEELTQDCFMKIWNKIGNYDKSKGRLFTWMINIARNLAIDKTRSKEFHQKLKSDVAEDHVSIQDKDYSDKHKPEYIGVKEMLEVLNPEQKDLLELMYFKGYSQSEIADEFNIPLGTVKTRVRAAISKLRGLF